MLMSTKQIAKVLKGLRNKNFKVESLDEMWVSRKMETLFTNLNNLISYRYSYKNIYKI